MKVRVLLFAPFRELFPAGEREVELGAGRTVRELLDALCDSDARRKALLDDSGEPKSHLTILVNGTPIKALEGVRTKLDEGDEVAMFPPIAGG